MQLGLNHHVTTTAEGEAFEIKEESKEPAYLIYRTIKFPLLIVFMHKASKKNQTGEDKFSFCFLTCLYQSISLLTRRKTQT